MVNLMKYFIVKSGHRNFIAMDILQVGNVLNAWVLTIGDRFSIMTCYNPKSKELTHSLALPALLV